MALEHVMLSEQDLYTYKCAVTNIVDGDTVDVMANESEPLFCIDLLTQRDAAPEVLVSSP